MRTIGLCMAVLTADKEPAALDRLGNSHDQRRRRTHEDFAILPAPLPHAGRDGLGKRQGIDPEAVHFPVAGDQWNASARHGPPLFSGRSFWIACLAATA